MLQVTDGKGVDVVVNPPSGRLLRETWPLIAEFGRFIKICRKDILQNSHLGMKQFHGHVTFSSVDLTKLFTQKPEELGQCMSTASDLAQAQVIVTIMPITIVPVSQITTGLRKLQTARI